MLRKRGSTQAKSCGNSALTLSKWPGCQMALCLALSFSSVGKKSMYKACPLERDTRVRSSAITLTQGALHMVTRARIACPARLGNVRIQGAVPGAKQALVRITPAVKARRAKKGVQ